ncbi:hypothetical protein [Streptomyces huasconensis]
MRPGTAEHPGGHRTGCPGEGGGAAGIPKASRVTGAGLAIAEDADRND